MKTTSAAWLLSLLAIQGCMVEEVAGHTHDKKGLHHRHNLYKGRIQETSDRIRKAQVDMHAPPKKLHNKRAASVTYTAPTTSSSTAVLSNTSKTTLSSTSTSNSVAVTTSKVTSMSTSTSTSISPSTTIKTTSTSSIISTSIKTTSTPSQTTTSSAPEPTETEIDDTVGVGKQVLNEQCGGLLYFGQRGCIKGLTCMRANTWFSYCRSPCRNGYGDICGGLLYFGQTCCPAPQECERQNFLWSTCQS